MFSQLSDRCNLWQKSDNALRIAPGQIESSLVSATEYCEMHTAMQTPTCSLATNNRAITVHLAANRSNINNNNQSKEKCCYLRNDPSAASNVAKNGAFAVWGGEVCLLKYCLFPSSGSIGG